MFAYLIAIPLIGHGLAHLSGVFAPWTRQMQGYSNAAWLFNNGIRLASPIGKGYGLVWLAAAVCLVLSGVELLLGQGYWMTIAILGSLLSLVAILSWWKAVPPGAKAGAVFDLVILVVMLSPLKEKIVQWIG